MTERPTRVCFCSGNIQLCLGRAHTVFVFCCGCVVIVHAGAASGNHGCRRAAVWGATEWEQPSPSHPLAHTSTCSTHEPGTITQRPIPCSAPGTFAVPPPALPSPAPADRPCSGKVRGGVGARERAGRIRGRPEAGSGGVDAWGCCVQGGIGAWRPQRAEGQCGWTPPGCT